MEKENKEISNLSGLEVNAKADEIIKQGFIDAGISSKKPFEVLAEGLEAYFERKGIDDNTGEQITIKVADFHTRHKYMVTALELMRILKPANNTTVDINNNFTFAQMVEVASKVRPVEVIND
jgi:hypothetical protein